MTVDEPPGVSVGGSTAPNGAAAAVASAAVGNGAAAASRFAPPDTEADAAAPPPVAASDDADVPRLPPPPFELSTLRLAAMLAADLGLSFCWVLKYALATPHLAHTLGASPPVAHALWALGPLTGLLAPVIGTLSDGHASPYGRRRPFVAAGAAASVVGMTSFAWAGCLLPASRGAALAAAFGGFGVWDVGLQAMLFPSRALLADILPAERAVQHRVQAVAAVLAGVAEVAAGGLVWGMAEPVRSIRSIFAGGALVLALTTCVSLVLCVEVPTDGRAPMGGDVEMDTVVGGDAWWQGPPLADAQEASTAPFLGGAPHGGGAAGGGPAAAQPSVAPARRRSVVAATLASMAALPPAVGRVIVVYALAWFSFFCTLPYFSAWLGTSVLGGTPSAARGTPAAAAYQRGVTIFSAASVVKAVGGLAFGGCYPALLRRLGGGGERLLLGVPLAAFAVVLGGVAGTHSGVVAGAAVAAAAVPFVVTQTIPVAMVVTPSLEGGGAPPAAVDADGRGGGGGGGGGGAMAPQGVVWAWVATALASTWGC